MTSCTAQDCISANAVPGSVRTVHHLDQFSTPELVRCHERALREPMAHVCVSQAVADELAAGWGISATVIPNGVDAPRFMAAASEEVAAGQARQRWRTRIAGRYVLVVGGIEPRKGTVDMVDAMADLAAEYPDVRLVVAGGETLFDYRADFDRRCTERRIDPLILGPVAEDDLPSLVAAADVFAFPSTKEGFGLAALEAAAAGVPLVMRDLPVLREVFGAVPTWFAGATLPDALGWALTRPDPGALSAGRHLAASYTWERAAAAHRAFYRQLPKGSDHG